MSKKPPRQRTRQWDRMKRETYLREALREVHSDLALVRGSQGGLTALSTLRRQAQQIRAELDGELDRQRREAERPRDEPTPDELRALLIDALADLGEHEYLDILGAVSQRRRGHLHLVEGS